VPITIERIRALVLAAAVLLLAAMGVFLLRAKWKNLLTGHDLPQQLSHEIQQEAKGFTFVHAYGAHSQFRIHASREVQLRNNRVELHEVQIELYGGDGTRVDEISGDTFEYDQKSGLAIAKGPVEMLLTRPSSAAGTGAVANQGSADNTPAQIDLKTSGVTFDQDTGIVATAQRVDFMTKRGEGSAVGALYDSQKGYLTLDHSVELKTRRGGEPVAVEAQQAELDRSAQSCLLKAAKVGYRGGTAEAAQARILFRTDGTAQQLDAAGGFTMQTASGSHLKAPAAHLDFDQHNQPLHGHLEGGVEMDSETENRTMHGSSPTAELEFAGRGQLRRARLERGVVFSSEEANPANAGQNSALRLTRTWHSPVVDLDFVDAGKGRLQLASIHGTGGVTVASESRRGNAPTVPSRMIADEITGSFGQGSALRTLTGVGHAAIEQTTPTGTRQFATGDHLEARFTEIGEQGSKRARAQAGKASDSSVSFEASKSRADDVQSAELDGHVVFIEQSAPKPAGPPQPPMRVTAGKAVYEGAGEWLHMTLSPRVEYGGLQLTAEKVDFSRQSGEAFARGDVKGTWTSANEGSAGGRSADTNNNPGPGAMSFGGKAPVHVVASEAQLNESTGEATFQGHARLWQLANSVSGPAIVLNQHKQTMTAKSSNPADPVKAVLLSAGGPDSGLSQHAAPKRDGNGDTNKKLSSSEVIRVSGGDLEYFDAEHRAVMSGGALGSVVAATGTSTSSSDAVELRLMPAPNPQEGRNGQTLVDRLTATGHVRLTAQGRTGSGEQLVYSSVTGEYVLTGSAAAPPKLTDPTRGAVTGEALIFHSGDDSVSIEGGGRATVTQTTAPVVHIK